MNRRIDKPLRMAVQCRSSVRRPRRAVADVFWNVAFHLELKVVAGPLRGKVLTFAANEQVVFGRDSDGQRGELPEDDPRASRRHFRLEIEAPRVWVRDLNSTHGTFVNGRDCRRADSAVEVPLRVELKDADVVQAGETRFEVILNRKGTSSQAGCRPGGLILQNRVGPPQIEGVDIRQSLGRSAWGAAYLCQHRPEGRLCVIKVVRAEQDLGPDLPELLNQACATLRASNHENLVRVQDHGVTRFGAAGWGLCLETEYCEGGNVSQAAKDKGGRLPAHEVHEVLGDSLAGLAWLHGRGMVHGNLKPTNLLFSQVGARRCARLADFALLPTLQRALAAAGPAVDADADTPAFAAPEQMGKPDALSPAADVWSLGAVFHLLLTGHPPLGAGKQGVAGAKPSRGHGGGIRKFYRVVPRSLEGLLDLMDHALAASPEDRFQNAIEMQEQFRRLPPPPAVRVEFA